MIERSFVHFPGVGATTERKLWDRGIRDWNCLQDAAPSLFRGPKLDTVKRVLDESREAWSRRDLHYFYSCLPRTELWRMVPGFLDEIAFLDIETNGLNLPPLAHSTTVTFYFQGVVYQEHEPDRKRALLHDMCERATLICTFFGEVFDVPFLRREFDHPIAKAHLDLCFWLKRLGYGGGLKKVEKLFPDIPQRQALDIDGFDAVRLWGLHRRGVPGALETLLHYNAEDTIVLEALLIKAFNLEVQNRPHLALTALPERPLARLSTRIHPHVYEMLRGSALN